MKRTSIVKQRKMKDTVLFGQDIWFCILEYVEEPVRLLKVSRSMLSLAYSHQLPNSIYSKMPTRKEFVYWLTKNPNVLAKEIDMDDIRIFYTHKEEHFQIVHRSNTELKNFGKQFSSIGDFVVTQLNCTAPIIIDDAFLPWYKRIVSSRAGFKHDIDDVLIHGLMNVLNTHVCKYALLQLNNILQKLPQHKTHILRIILQEYRTPNYSNYISNIRDTTDAVSNTTIPFIGHRRRWINGSAAGLIHHGLTQHPVKMYIGLSLLVGFNIIITYLTSKILFTILILYLIKMIVS